MVEIREKQTTRNYDYVEPLKKADEGSRIIPEEKKMGYTFNQSRDFSSFALGP